MQTRVVMIGLLAALATVGAACGGVDGSDGGDDPPEALTDVLRALPDDAELLEQIDYVDHRAVRLAAGLDADQQFDDIDELTAFIDVSSLLSAQGRGAAFLTTRIEESVALGLDPFGIDTEVSVGAGPLAIADLHMRVDLDELTPYLDELAAEHDGLREFDLDPSKDLSRQLIGANVISVADDRLVLGGPDRSDLVRAVVDSDEPDDSLADREDVQAVLEPLGDVARIYLTGTFAAADDVLRGVDDADAVAAALDLADAPDDPLLAAIGLDLDEDDDEAVVGTAAIAFADEDAAEAAAQWYEQVLDEGRLPRRDLAYDEVFDDVEITVDGSTVVVRFTATRAPIALAYAAELPFLWHAS